MTSILVTPDEHLSAIEKRRRDGIAKAGAHRVAAAAEKASKFTPKKKLAAAGSGGFAAGAVYNDKVSKGKNSATVKAGLKMVGHGVKGIAKDPGNRSSAVKLGILGVPAAAGVGTGVAIGRRRKDVSKAFGIEVSKAAVPLEVPSAPKRGAAPGLASGADRASKIREGLKPAKLALIRSIPK